MSRKPADGVCWRTRGSGSSLRNQLGCVSEGRLTAFTVRCGLETSAKEVGGCCSACLCRSSFAGPPGESVQDPVPLAEGIWPGVVRGLVPSLPLSAGWCKAQRALMSEQAAGVSQCQQLCMGPRAHPGAAVRRAGPQQLPSTVGRLQRCRRGAGWAEGTRDVVPSAPSTRCCSAP